MKRIATTLLTIGALAAATSAFADGTYQTLPFSQNWSNTGLITADDNWSGVPGIIGYRGDNITGATGADPQTLLADDTGLVVDVNANLAAPAAFVSGGVCEFEISDPVVSFQGSGTGDAPYLQIHINATNKQNITVNYLLRDIDDSTDDTNQQVAAHYRVGTSGSWTNLPAAYVADASTGPSLAVQVTPVSFVLPAAANGQAQVQIRIMTTNAPSFDEQIGVDDITIVGSDIPVPTAKSTWGSVKSLYR